MLGAEQSILKTYVAEGQVKLVFWDNLDSSQRATYLHTVARCAGRQDPALFWKMHDYIFRNQASLVNIDDEQITQSAVNLGVDREAYEACLADGTGLADVEGLEQIAEERGIRSRPIFDIDGTQLFGSQPFSAFQAAIDDALMRSQ